MYNQINLRGENVREGEKKTAKKAKGGAVRRGKGRRVARRRGESLCEGEKKKARRAKARVARRERVWRKRAKHSKTGSRTKTRHANKRETVEITNKRLETIQEGDNRLSCKAS